jgi:hypothetical protein
VNVISHCIAYQKKKKKKKSECNLNSEFVEQFVLLEILTSRSGTVPPKVSKIIIFVYVLIKCVSVVVHVCSL